MPAPQKLHQLLDAISEDQYVEAELLLRQLREAPDEGDFVLSPEEDKAICVGLDSLAAGKGRPAEEVFARWRKTAP